MSFLGLLPAFPEIGLSILGMIYLVVGAYKGNACTRMISWLTVLTLIVAVFVLLGLEGADKAYLFNDFFVLDHFALYVKIMIVFSVSMSLYLSFNYNEYEGINRFEYPILVLYATVGMMMMISANDLISLYIGIELQSLSLYVIAAFQRDNLQSSEAGLKYFVLGALSSGIFLYGASLIYGFTGTTNFSGLVVHFQTVSVGAPALLGMVFILAGLAFKISAVPFHMWTPDVYEGAATPVTALFSIAPKIAALGLFVRVFIEPFGAAFSEIQILLIVGAVLTMFIGSLGALQQTNIKRLMAYSSIGHVGFALLGLLPGTEEGVRNLLLYLSIYIFMNLGVFAVILSLRRDGQYVTEISQLSGLSKTNPMLAFVMTLLMFSMAGIPPLAGFFAKLYVLMAVVHAGLIWVAILAVLASVIAAFYYLRIIKVMYFDAQENLGETYFDGELRPVLVISSAVILFFFLAPAVILNWASLASHSLFAG